MSPHLKEIQNWQDLAREANWSGAVLAKKCGVSLRTLQRFFLNEIGKSPKNWLQEQRQIQAAMLLRKGGSVKEVANRLSYKHPSHFTNSFKKHWGYPPSDGLTRSAG